MARWQADTEGRLKLAAIELFGTHGFEAVTVSDIAAAVGVTERTFFRYFTDKREVLFTNQDDYQARFLDALLASEATAPMTLVEAALHGGAAFFADERRPWSRARQRIVDSSAALMERESLKRSSLTDALTTALIAKGVAPVPAALAAQSGSAAFHLAFAAWIADDETRSFTELLDDVLADLRALLG
ncbi:MULTISPECIES: TetR family transcriptional regulator [unclassified Plantibacter]|uniref:TetR family transcriptional regulator n=1 Tax=unclassified Plantibacter TaxID=2624265 RepID=UPI0017817925|nr:TetR family transcriptional regulator [Plantibacter sp. CFBP 8775]MBD8104577.1 TetR family transcriptional regulator [Plantibacter sp. CFBP 8775]